MKVNENFGKRLLWLLAQSRKESFMGIDEGAARADLFVQMTNWQEAAPVKHFFNLITHHY